jgi:hypothetical protein
VQTTPRPFLGGVDVAALPLLRAAEYEYCVLYRICRKPIKLGLTQAKNGVGRRVALSRGTRLRLRVCDCVVLAVALPGL